MNKVVVGIGEALWDVFPDGKKIGGAPANFAFHVSQFGLESCAVSAIGDDVLGREIIDTFNASGLDYILEKVDEPTGTVQVELDENGVPSYIITEDVAWDNIPFSDNIAALAGRCRAVCFGSLAQRSKVSASTISRFLKAMPEDSLKVFDINLRQHFYNKDIICCSLEVADILKINDDEVVTVAEMLGYQQHDKAEISRRLLREFALKMVVLTCGAVDSYVFAPDTESRIDTPKVNVVSTVGAGDSFTGTFVAALLKGKDIVAAHQLAVEVSAYVCTQTGAMPLLPEHLKDSL